FMAVRDHIRVLRHKQEANRSARSDFQVAKGTNFVKASHLISTTPNVGVEPTSSLLESEARPIYQLGGCHSKSISSLVLFLPNRPPISFKWRTRKTMPPLACLFRGRSAGRSTTSAWLRCSFSTSARTE